MKRLLLNILVFSLLVNFLSCMEEQDFDQFDTLRMVPTVTTGLLYFETDEPSINAIGLPNGIAFYSKTTNFAPFENDYVKERLLRATIVYQITNTTSKELGLNIEFLDDSGIPIHTESFSMEAHPAAAHTREVAYGPGGLDLNLLMATTRLRFTALNLGDASTVSSAQDPKLILKSSGEFIFQLQ